MIPFVALICTDLRILFRTGYLWATLAIFAVLLFLALQVARLEFSGLADFVAAIILLDAVLAPVLVVGLMMLLERGEGSLAALSVSPLRPWTYLQARTITVSLVSSAQMLLLALVLCASMMPVESLPPPSWETVFSLGFISAMFDNSPLTALALNQGGYDWGVLAYAVGFGGSMVWLGASAGWPFPISFPKPSRCWLGCVRLGGCQHVIGFFVMLGTMGWHPETSSAVIPESH